MITPIPRIVIPVYGRIERLHRDDDPHLNERVLVGWMAPAIDPVEVGLPQVLSCPFMRKSHFLYGRVSGMAPGAPWSGERHWERFSDGTVIKSVIAPLVVVEDPPDVWRLDPRAAAVFGAEISDAQKRILCEECGGRPIVVFFNRGSGEAAAQAGRRLQAERPADPWADGPSHWWRSRNCRQAATPSASARPRRPGVRSMPRSFGGSSSAGSGGATHPTAHCGAADRLRTASASQLMGSGRGPPAARDDGRRGAVPAPNEVSPVVAPIDAPGRSAPPAASLWARLPAARVEPAAAAWGDNEQ
jgi:hypothetical protein